MSLCLLILKILKVSPGSLWFGRIKLFTFGCFSRKFFALKYFIVGIFLITQESIPKEGYESCVASICVFFSACFVYILSTIIYNSFFKDIIHHSWLNCIIFISYFFLLSFTYSRSIQPCMHGNIKLQPSSIVD